MVETNARIRVLIAEDDEGVREILASVVRSEPAFELAGTVADAAQAILAAVEQQPDVALVDVRMPGGGASAARGIKQRSPHTVVLAFSAHDDALTMQEMYEAGADGYLVKGSTVATIVASIRRRGRQARRLPPRRLTELSRLRPRGRARPARRPHCARAATSSGSSAPARRACRGSALDLPAGRHDLDRSEIGGAALERVQVEGHGIGVAGGDCSAERTQPRGRVARERRLQPVQEVGIAARASARS